MTRSSWRTQRARQLHRAQRTLRALRSRPSTGPSPRPSPRPSAGRSAGRSAGTAPGLREAWRRRSLAAGWSMPDDWYAPAVDTVTEAVRTGADLAGPLRTLGESRGMAGAGITETLDDLGALLGLTSPASDPFDLVKPVAQGWAEAGLVTQSRSTCEDPLTGLATLPYLRTRLGEVYREARGDGTWPSDTHRLLVVALAASTRPWQRMARAIVIGHDLRVAFPGGETLSLAGPSRLIVLARASPGRDPVTTGLRHMLADTHGARVRTFPLPFRHEEALRLLNRLAAP